MADGSGTSGPIPPQQHSGVVRRSDYPRGPRRSTSRNDWLALVGVLALMAIVLVFVASFFGRPSPSPIPSSSTSPSLVADVSGSTLPTYSAPPTATPTPSLSPSPTPYATPVPTAPPTVPPTPTPSPPPSPPVTGLIVVDPTDRSTVGSNTVTVHGLAQPGAPITQDVPMWFDNHTTADASGQWSFDVSLSQGWNAFKFRVGDDAATELTINLYFGG
jgi:hypothetical protein